MKPSVNNVVSLLDDIPLNGLLKGSIGVIIEEFQEPEEAYEIEFVGENGEIINQVTLFPRQFEVVK